MSPVSPTPPDCSGTFTKVLVDNLLEVQVFADAAQARGELDIQAAGGGDGLVGAVVGNQQAGSPMAERGGGAAGDLT